MRKQLGIAQTTLRTKEGEFSALDQEHDRLAKKLADQEESHKAALKAAQDSEAALKAEYETVAASWAEARQALSEGYRRVEDLVDGRPPSSSFFWLSLQASLSPDLLCFFLLCEEYFPGYSVAANQAIEACHEERRQAGAEIAPNARRSLEELLLAIQARLQPAHRMLRWL